MSDFITKYMFRIVFVLDLYNNKVVHAQGGDRKKYLPVNFKSTICTSSNPLEIIQNIMPKEVYIADLNLLQNDGLRQINFPIIKQISFICSTMVDAGIKTVEDANEINLITQNIIVGTESASFSVIKDVVSIFPNKVTISIDKKNNRILSNYSDIPKDPFLLLKELNGLNIKDVIILDLDKVGTNKGIDSQFLSKIVTISNKPVLLGGGIRNLDDISMLKQIGIKGALIATAFHIGAIPIDILHK